MPVTAKLRYLRIAPRKVRLVADLIRGKSVKEAQRILEFTRKKSAQPILKLLKSAIANARHNFQLEEENLFISKILVDEGPKYKRWLPRARGVAYPIQKRTSHLTIFLDQIKKEELKKEIKKIEPKEEKKKPKEKKREKLKPKPKPALELKKAKSEKSFPKLFRRKAF
jgi:large subunit ribosomal protein L22